MKIKYNNNIISGIVFLTVSVILFILIPSQIQTMETSSINAQTMPTVAIIGMLLFSIGLLFQGIFTSEKKQVIINKQFFKSESFRKEMKSVLYAIMLLVYIVLFTYAGFLVANTLLVISILLYYGARKWYYYAIPLSMVVVVYYIFKVLLYVSLP